MVLDSTESSGGIRSLQELVDRQEPPVLVVVGSGVSFGATGQNRATWRGLLNHGLDYLFAQGVWDEEKVTAERFLINDSFDKRPNLEEVLRRADSVTDGLGGPDGPMFAHWLKEAIGTLRAADGQTTTLDAIRDLADAGAIVMTTNYDDLLCDALELPPVTWLEPEAVLQVINRKRPGIIHIHGHWRQPKSIVFGKRSYEAIVQSEPLQTVLSSLWLQWHWMYVGAGAGLQDPNLGALLKWVGQHFGSSGRVDYFFGKPDQVEALQLRSDSLANVVPIPLADFDVDLPAKIRALTPQLRASPFELLLPSSTRFRQPSESKITNPFPTWQEYAEGRVPSLPIDLEVKQRLQHHGWAMLVDVASVGKTTLALRIATLPEQRPKPVYYLELKRTDDNVTAFATEAYAALRRLARPGTLIVLDNAHHNPALALGLWQRWRERPNGSRLLIVVTRMEKPIVLSGDSALLALEGFVGNPALSLDLTPMDLGAIFNRVIDRLSSGQSAGLPTPPESALLEWHKTYGGELGAFVTAIIQERGRLSPSNWTLPVEAASEWMRERHLRYLSDQELENVLCLSVFGAQELEIDVSQPALPYPLSMATPLTRGLAERIEVADGKYVRFKLREPGWGKLVIGAIRPKLDNLTILTSTCARSLDVAIALDAALGNAGRIDQREAIWLKLNGYIPELLESIWKVEPGYMAAFLSRARQRKQFDLAKRLWDALAADRDRLSDAVCRSSLMTLTPFMNVAQEQGPATVSTVCWDALSDNVGGLVDRALRSSLGDVVGFLGVAHKFRRRALLEALWAGFSSHPDALASRAVESTLDIVAAFLLRATNAEQWTLVNAIWSALSKNPKDLASRAIETPFENLGAFIARAMKSEQKDLLKKLWQALAQDETALINRALGAPFKDLAAFLATAHRQSAEEPIEELTILLENLWMAFSRNSAHLAKRALSEPLSDLAAFTEIASKQGPSTLVDRIWRTLEDDPVSLAGRALDTPLGNLAGFLRTAKRQKKATLVDALWDVLVRDPAALAKKISESDTASISALIASLTLENLASLPKVFQFLSIEDWAFDPGRSFHRFPGAAGLALRFAQAGREDLKIALLDNLLKRADPRDFEDVSSALLELGKLLSNVEAQDEASVSKFARAICRSEWLGRCYGATTTVGLASALTMIATHQSAEIIRLLWHPGLKYRLRAELGKLSQAAPDHLSVVVQFFGASALCCRSPDVVTSLPLRKIAQLPSTVLPHRAESNEVERWQRQLWYGLRAICSFTSEPLAVGEPVLTRTLALWQASLAEVETKPGSVLHRIDASMVRWLRNCQSSGGGRIYPDEEPLWTLTGFPQQP